MSAGMLRANALMIDYLTPAARAVWTALCAGGMDPDLALAVVEQVAPDDEIFRIEEDESARDSG